jgi:hypothetical protein
MMTPMTSERSSTLRCVSPSTSCATPASMAEVASEASSVLSSVITAYRPRLAMWSAMNRPRRTICSRRRRPLRTDE